MKKADVTVYPKSTTDQLMYSTIRIFGETKDGTSTSGTGYFYRYSENGIDLLDVVVTNKHVVEDAQKGIFRLHKMKKNENGEPNLAKGFIDFEINDFNKKWFFHPDPDVDLCIMLNSKFVDEASKHNISPYINTISSTMGATIEELQHYNAVEDVLMVGYPIGMADEVNNFPIFRKGITSSHPAVNFDGKIEGLVDIACFPGSSGSPIFLIDTKYGKTSNGPRYRLLGTLYAGPTFDLEGEVKKIKIPTKKIKNYVSVTSMIHLGFYAKDIELKNLCQIFYYKEILRTDIPTHQKSTNPTPTSNKENKK